MKQWKTLFALLLAVAVFSVMIFSPGCGDPNREDCKKSCDKLKECDTENNPEGERYLDDNFVNSCKAACDEADEINGTSTTCILKTPCADIAQECGTGN